MSGALARMAFRLAAAQALRASPFIAAACPGRVYDSLVGVFDDGEPVPVIVLATEDDNGEEWSKNNGGPPFDQTIDATLEITVCQYVAGDDDVVNIFVPATDPESEALLDALEFFAVEALTEADTPASDLLRRAVTRRVTRYRSVRYTTDDTSAKLARRLVTLTIHLKGDDGPASALDVPTGPFAALPDPLRTVVASLPAGSSGLATVEALIERLTPPVPPERLEGVTIAYAPQRLDPDQAPSQTDPDVPTTWQEIDIDE